MARAAHAGEARLVTAAREAAMAAESIVADAVRAVCGRVSGERGLSAPMADREQRATHGVAWLATYVEAIRQLAAYAERMHAAGELGEIEDLIVRIGIGEYLAQILGGIPMSQSEIVRPADLGLSGRAIAQRMAGPLDGLMSDNETRRARLVALLGASSLATVPD